MSVRGGIKLVLGVSVGAALSAGYLTTSTNETVWKNISLPLIQKLDAETAHVLAVKTASWGLVPEFKTKDEDKNVLKTRLWDIDFECPIGLAAGFDKNADCYDGMLKMGFGFVEVGSITPLPQIGNPKPRVFRLKEDQAVINRYGFNSNGLQYALSNLKGRQSSVLKPSVPKGIVGVNIGKNKLQTDNIADYQQGVTTLGAYADYLVINVSSPNTPGLRSLQGKQALSDLLKKVLKSRKELPNCPPLLVKIAPDLTAEDKEDIADVVLNPETRIDGLIISNTTITRPSYLMSENKVQGGGLSGKPLKDLSTQCIKDMFLLTKGKIPIIGVGGVADGKDAYDKICSGASLVQLYSALSLQGPPVVGKVKRELAELLRDDGFSNVADAVGADVIPFQCTRENTK